MGIEQSIAYAHATAEEVLDVNDLMDDFVEDEVVNDGHRPKREMNRQDKGRKCPKEKNADTLHFNADRRHGMRMNRMLPIYNRSKSKQNLHGDIRAYVQDASSSEEEGNPWLDHDKVEYYDYLDRKEEERREEVLRNCSPQEAALYAMNEDYGDISFYEHIINRAPYGEAFSPSF